MTSIERLAEALAYLDGLHAPEGLPQTISLEPDGQVEISIFAADWMQADRLIRAIDPTLTIDQWDIDPGGSAGHGWATYTGPGMPQHLREITVFSPRTDWGTL